MTGELFVVNKRSRRSEGKMKEKLKVCSCWSEHNRRALFNDFVQYLATNIASTSLRCSLIERPKPCQLTWIVCDLRTCKMRLTKSVRNCDFEAQRATRCSLINRERLIQNASNKSFKALASQLVRFHLLLPACFFGALITQGRETVAELLSFIFQFSTKVCSTWAELSQLSKKKLLTSNFNVFSGTWSFESSTMPLLTARRTRSKNWFHSMKNCSILTISTLTDNLCLAFVLILSFLKQQDKSWNMHNYFLVYLWFDLPAVSRNNSNVRCPKPRKISLKNAKELGYL